MSTVSKKNISSKIGEEHGVRGEAAKRVIDCFLDEIINELAKGNRIELRKFGIFSPVCTKARTGRNPRTGEKIEIPAKKSAKFKYTGPPLKKDDPNE
jgi:integration host factor subunit beta